MKNKLNKELAVCGFEAVKALERNSPEKIRRLYFTADRAAQFGDLCRSMAQRKAPYNQVESGAELEKLCGSVHHQGVVAMIPQPEILRLSPADVDKWVMNKEDVLLLDRVGNANNVGAIIRSAAFFGVKNIVIPLDEAQAGVTTSAYRVAQGGMEKVSVYSVKSMESLIRDAKGKFAVFGTDVRGSKSISKMGSLRKKKRSDGTEKLMPVMIVLGNEEHGISREISELCDHLVTIPAPADNMESLNVAQAAAVILYELRRE
ncbi:MAG: RNA methyltransferase [Treponemataceae bacterium]|nr:RNA methyltransferase [Treponemataceae bacterium]